MLKFEELAQDIYLLKTPFSDLWSGAFLIKCEENTIIDTGAGADIVDTYIIPALAEINVTPESIRWLLNTHAHGDHSNGNTRLLEVTGARFAAFETAADKFIDPLTYSRRTREKYPAYSPKTPAFIPSCKPDFILREGDILAGRLIVYSTPGHDTECISLLDTKTNTLLTGDSLQLCGTHSAAGRNLSFYKDLQAYLSTIEKIRKLAPENIFTSHDYEPEGFAFRGRENAAHCLDICENAVNVYRRRVGELMDSGETDVAVIARELIKSIDGKESKFIFTDMYTADEHIAEYKAAHEKQKQQKRDV
jgi:glyoxylase-like metal-dependent hydrolase (beta-lactamase superfamily II)